MSIEMPTEACTLLSLISSCIPNLLKYVAQYSATNPKKSPALSLILFSDQQILDARAHPSDFIKQGIISAAIIQSALNYVSDQFDTFVRQTKEIDSLLANYLAEKNSNSVCNELEKHLIQTTMAEKELKTIIANVSSQFEQVDQLLDKHATLFTNHREEYANKSIEQLTALGINLTAEEKAALQTGSESLSSIRERRKRLKQHSIDLAEDESDFIVAIYDTIVAFKSRNFDKVSGKSSIKEIVKDLSGIIKEEGKLFNKLQATQIKEHENTRTKAKQFVNQAKKFNTQLIEQRQLITRTKMQQESAAREIHLASELTH